MYLPKFGRISNSAQNMMLCFFNPKTVLKIDLLVFLTETSTTIYSWIDWTIKVSLACHMPEIFGRLRENIIKLVSDFMKKSENEPKLAENSRNLKFHKMFQ